MMMSYTVRRMREEDIPQVVEIEKIAFSRPWTKSIFKAALLLPYAAYYVAVEDTPGEKSGADPHEKVVGMCGVKKIFEEGDISNVAVHPAYRGRGISRKMLDVLMREARADGVQAFTLEVRAGNVIAVNLYESLGFRTEGVRPRFYDDPVEDGLIMWQRP
jgi:ribosomal-protein-alanine N-acetyltransferase